MFSNDVVCGIVVAAVIASAVLKVPHKPKPHIYTDDAKDFVTVTLHNHKECKR